MICLHDDMSIVTLDVTQCDRYQRRRKTTIYKRMLKSHQLLGMCGVAWEEEE